MTRLKPTDILLVLAILAFAASWFTPVFAMTDPATLFTATTSTVSYRGYRVFWTVVSLLWSSSELHGWKDALTFTLYIASALTNVIFVAAVAALLASWRSALAQLQWLVFISGLLDLYWFFEIQHLKVGFYLWIVAFFLLFAAMARRSAS